MPRVVFKVFSQTFSSHKVNFTAGGKFRNERWIETIRIVHICST